MTLTEIIGLGGVPVIVALVQVAKGWVADERVYPLLALAFGLAINLGAGWATGAGLPQTLVYGLVAGLAASGLYSQGKAVIQ